MFFFILSYFLFFLSFFSSRFLCTLLLGTWSKILTPTRLESAASKFSVAGQPTAATTPGKVLTGDLDSSLASLAENLTINKSAQPQK